MLTTRAPHPSVFQRKRGSRFKEQDRKEQTAQLEEALKKKRADQSRRNADERTQAYMNYDGTDPRIRMLLRQQQAEAIEEVNEERVVVDQLPTTQRPSYSRTKALSVTPQYHPPGPEPGPSELEILLQNTKEQKQQQQEMLTEEEREKRVRSIQEQNQRQQIMYRKHSAVADMEKKRHALQYEAVIYYARLVHQRQMTREQARKTLLEERRIQISDKPYLEAVYQKEKARHEALQRGEELNRERRLHYYASTSRVGDKVELPRRTMKEIDEEGKLIELL